MLPIHQMRAAKVNYVRAPLKNVLANTDRASSIAHLHLELPLKFDGFDTYPICVALRHARKGDLAMPLRARYPAILNSEHAELTMGCRPLIPDAH